MRERTQVFARRTASDMLFSLLVPVLLFASAQAQILPIEEDGDEYDVSKDVDSEEFYYVDSEHDREERIIHLLNYYLSGASIVGGLIVLVVIMSMFLYDKKLVNRVSLRLTAFISFADILASVTAILYSTYIYRQSIGDSIGCTMLGLGMSLFPQIYLFLTVMIAFNLQLVFLHRRKVSIFSDRWYIPVAILAAVAINAFPLAFNRFGYDPLDKDCLYRDRSSMSTRYWQLFTFVVPVALAMIYCTVVLGIVVFKIGFENRRLRETIRTRSATTSEKARQKRSLVLKLVSRISLYASIPLLTVGGIVVDYTWNVIQPETVPFGIIVWSVVGSCLPGFLNCLAFLFDPAVHNALRKVKRDLIITYGYGDISYLMSPPLTPMTGLTPIQPIISQPSQTGSQPSSQPSAVSRANQRLTRIIEEKRKNNKFMTWFVRTFLVKRRPEPTTPGVGSLPGAGSVALSSAPKGKGENSAANNNANGSADAANSKKRWFWFFGGRGKVGKEDDVHAISTDEYHPTPSFVSSNTEFEPSYLSSRPTTGSTIVMQQHTQKFGSSPAGSLSQFVVHDYQDSSTEYITVNVEANAVNALNGRRVSWAASDAATIDETDYEMMRL